MILCLVYQFCRVHFGYQQSFNLFSRVASPGTFGAEAAHQGEEAHRTTARMQNSTAKVPSGVRRLPLVPVIIIGFRLHVFKIQHLISTYTKSDVALCMYWNTNYVKQHLGRCCPHWCVWLDSNLPFLFSFFSGSPIPCLLELLASTEHISTSTPLSRLQWYLLYSRLVVLLEYILFLVFVPFAVIRCVCVYGRASARNQELYMCMPHVCVN